MVIDMFSVCMVTPKETILLKIIKLLFLSVEYYTLLPLHFIPVPHTYHRCYYMTKCKVV